MTTAPEAKKDKRRRGPRVPALPDEKTGKIKRSFYIMPQDYKPVSDAFGGDISDHQPLMIAVWMAMDGNVQDFVRETHKKHGMVETISILKKATAREDG